MYERQGVSEPPARPGSDDQRRRDGYIYIGLLAGLLLVGFAAMSFSDDSDDFIAAPATEVLAEAPALLTQSSVAPTTALTATTTTLRSTTSPSTAAAPTTVPAATSSTSTIPLANRSLERIDSVYGNIAPKSVFASPSGLFFAQNMMYRHTVTVYDEWGSLLRTIDDEVDLREFGYADRAVSYTHLTLPTNREV